MNKVPSFPLSITNIFAVHKARKNNPDRLFPLLPDRRATVMVAVSNFLLMYSFLFGMAPILIFYLMWLPLIYTKGVFTLNPTKDLWGGIAYASLATISFLWSGDHGKSLYVGLELVSTLACGFIIMRMVSSKALMRGLSISFMFILLVSLASGRYGGDPLSDTYSLIGFFGSKNTIGLMAELGLLSAIPLFVGEKSFAGKFFYSVLPSIIGGWCLLASKSASSLLSLIVLLIFLGFVHWVTLLPHRLRMPVFVFLFLTLVISAASFFALDLQGIVFEAVGKEATLTGRTYLWGEGLKAFEKHLFLGHGFYGFWVHSNNHAQVLLSEFGVSNKVGFHFHSAYIQTLVDLGIVGFIVVAFVLLKNVFLVFSRVIRDGFNPSLFFFFSLALLFLLRGFVEIDFLGVFNFATILFFGIVAHIKLWDRPPKAKECLIEDRL